MNFMIILFQNLLIFLWFIIEDISQIFITIWFRFLSLISHSLNKFPVNKWSLFRRMLARRNDDDVDDGNLIDYWGCFVDHSVSFPWHYIFILVMIFPLLLITISYTYIDSCPFVLLIDFPHYPMACK